MATISLQISKLLMLIHHLPHSASQTFSYSFFLPTSPGSIHAQLCNHLNYLQQIPSRNRSSSSGYSVDPQAPCLEAPPRRAPHQQPPPKCDPAHFTLVLLPCPVSQFTLPFSNFHIMLNVKQLGLDIMSLFFGK